MLATVVTVTLIIVFAGLSLSRFRTDRFPNAELLIQIYAWSLETDENKKEPEQTARIHTTNSASLSNATHEVPPDSTGGTSL
ncbi:hypothetical protein GO013_15940 [Pseudodesulfovibrio sp. JC047]|uniref:hypothetical protein n=1 Tax=Pseudodesulfovibrio sp. JC047 TaxID=2683199 RepID=UPI0013D11BDC|nr:hypothetical protein [Pseudodesulfovibrio sp. JC047]NDV20902.1 hypothetical protein [Pseudodesulfovibrio sp. JC047]